MADSRKSAVMDWTAEDEYWRQNYSTRPYVGSNRSYDQWQPAYRYGYESAQRYKDKKWDEVEHDLRSGWDKYEHRGTIASTWDSIKEAVRDGWNRITGHK